MTSMNQFASTCFFVFALFAAYAQDPGLEVCKLIKGAKRYDGKTVTVTGFVRGGGHLVGIYGDSCSRGVVISYNAHAVPQAFASGIEAKRLNLDPRPLKVTVKGRFMRKARAPSGYIDRLDVAEVLWIEFIGDKQPVSEPPRSLISPDDSLLSFGRHETGIGR